jgi:hypothetical protein
MYFYVFTFSLSALIAQYCELHYEHAKCLKHIKISNADNIQTHGTLTHTFIAPEMGKETRLPWANTLPIPFHMILTCKAKAVI